MSSIPTIPPDPAAPPAPEREMSVAPIGLPRYQVVRELGRGTMGIVHQAHDLVADRMVALKTVPIPVIMTATERQDFVNRFLAEARIVTRLTHPNIVRVFDFGQDEPSGLLFVALEYLDGAPLSEIVSPSSPLPWPEALRIAERVADALSHAHGSGIVHRDVKPANLILLAEGDPKLLDFGIAKIAEAPGHWSIAGQVVGTPLYMSPEQVMGEPVDARSDVFALGAVLYFLLTGRAPFAAPTIPHILLRVMHDDPPPASLLVLHLPADVGYVIARATAKSPAHRYPSAAAMAEDIADVLAGRPARHREDWTPPRPSDSTPPALAAADAALAELEADLGGPAEVPAAAHVSLGTSIGLTAERRAARIGRLRRLAWVAAAVLVASVVLTLVGGHASQARAGRPTDSAAGFSVASARVVTPRALPARPAAGVEVRRPAAARAAVLPIAPTPVVTLSPVEADATEPPPAAIAPRPAHLAVEVEHSLRGGRLRLWVDDVLRLDRAIDGTSGKKVTLGEVLAIEPGVHRVKVALLWDRTSREAELIGTFLPDENRRLAARMGGLLKKKVAVQWRDVPPSSPLPVRAAR